MEINNYIVEINALKNEVAELKNKNNDLQEHLKKYTNSKSKQKYYENNSDIVNEKAKIYKEKIKREDPDKIKKWAHAAYLKQKEKKQLLLNQN
jgi:hypothetical protein